MIRCVVFVVVLVAAAAVIWMAGVAMRHSNNGGPCGRATTSGKTLEKVVGCWCAMAFAKVLACTWSLCGHAAFSGTETEPYVMQAFPVRRWSLPFLLRRTLIARLTPPNKSQNTLFRVNHPSLPHGRRYTGKCCKSASLSGCTRKRDRP